MNETNDWAGSTIAIAGVHFRVASVPSATREIVSHAVAKRAIAVRAVNAYSLTEALSHPEYLSLMAGDGINYPDGTPISIAMRIKSTRADTAPRRVRGPSLFRSVLANSEGLSHFLLGTNADTLQLLESAIKRDFPSATIVGSYAPEYAPVTTAFLEKCENAIAPCCPDLVWVGLGTPKQDFVAQHLASKAGVVAIGVGAAFDFVAGTVTEAPIIVQKSGFEWLYRLLSEPRRLWRRYLVGNLRFAILVARAELSAGSEHRTRSRR